MAANPVQTAAITTAAGDNTIVAAQAGKRIRVLGYVLTASAAVTFTWKTGNAGSGSNVALSGTMNLGTSPLTVGTGQQIPMPWGWLETAVGELLNLNASGVITGHIMYLVFD